MIGIPPFNQQTAVIEKIKAVITSPDPRERAQTQVFMRQYGRSFLGTAANAATGGFTDWLMTHAPKRRRYCRQCGSER